ncbi:MAG TPA: hypothetical protein VLL08_19665 [Kineosporiaceae bacterium]|nr:hypothetical protein [Kineosporiaceae bacterium]
MDEPESGAVDLVPALLRWRDFGGVWRLIALSEQEASVALCRCDGGEEVERLSSSHPATLAFLAEFPDSEFPNSEFPNSERADGTGAGG